MSNTIKYTAKCPFCGKTTTRDYPYEGWMKFMSGAHVQDAFPDMSADDRELLITGICKDCYPSEPEEEAD